MQAVFLREKGFMITQYFKLEEHTSRLFYSAKKNGHDNSLYRKGNK